MGTVFEQPERKNFAISKENVNRPNFELSQ